MATELAPISLPLRVLSRKPARPLVWSSIALSRRLLRNDRAYRSVEGLGLRIDPNDPYQVRMMLGLYNPATVASIRELARPTSVVIDAGAHIGYFSLHAAMAVGRQGAVHAFECDPRLAERLRDHIELNAAHQIQANEMALLDRAGDFELQLAEQWGWTSLKYKPGEDAGTVTVPAVALDRYLDQAGVRPRDVSLVKLDIEGSEPEALLGMSATLENGSPALLIEVDAERHDREQLLDILSAHGYRPDPGLTPFAADGPPVADFVFRKRPAG